MSRSFHSVADRRLATLGHELTRIAGCRRRLTAGLLGAALAIGVALPTEHTTAKKKGKKKCPAGESRCPKGYPSRCCPPETTCCDTSRGGCCAR